MRKDMKSQIVNTKTKKIPKCKGLTLSIYAKPFDPLIAIPLSIAWLPIASAIVLMIFFVIFACFSKEDKGNKSQVPIFSK